LQLAFRGNGCGLTGAYENRLASFQLEYAYGASPAGDMGSAIGPPLDFHSCFGIWPREQDKVPDSELKIGGPREGAQDNRSLLQLGKVLRFTGKGKSRAWGDAQRSSTAGGEHGRSGVTRA